MQYQLTGDDMATVGKRLSRALVDLEVVDNVIRRRDRRSSARARIPAVAASAGRIVPWIRVNERLEV